MITADQRSSPHLAMSQCAHAGRLLLAEYGADLKRAILRLAGELEPFYDDGARHRCAMPARRGPRPPTPAAERKRFVTNACVYTTFLWGVQLKILDEIDLSASS